MSSSPSDPTLAELLAEAPPEVAVHQGTDTVDLDELRAMSASIAAALTGLGVEPGQVVAALLPNQPVTVAALFGVWQAGAVYAPCNPRAPMHEIFGALQAVAPAAILTTPAHIDDFVETFSGDTTTGAGWAVRHAGAGEIRRQREGTALIQFTSGTTGRPKPVPLAHATVRDLLDKVLGTLRGGRASASATEKRPPMPNLIPVSLSLWAGIYQVLFALRVGAPIVLMDRFDTATFAELVHRYGIRSTVLPPAAMTMLTDDEAIDDLTPLRMVRSITAPLSPAQARRFRDRFGVVVLNSYGQTELGGEVVGWSAADAREHGETKLGSVGRAHTGVGVRSADADGTPLPTGESGELFVRTPATTAGGISPDFADRLTTDGWFRTGDIGRVDDEGFVWIEGRVSDMINRGGLKVFPAQVEEALLSAPGVRDAAVVGVPDPRLGEVPWAFVVANGEGCDEHALEAWCRDRLAAYKVPTRFVTVAALPRNEVGKVLKRELTARIED